MDAGFAVAGVFDGGVVVAAGVDSERAEELTAGPGYDYQPDCSSDGRWVVYVKYDKDAMELWALDLKAAKAESGKARQLTSGGAVNVDPRFSPDGKRIAFVSTSYKGHFHIFVGDFNHGQLTNIQRLTGETRSDLPRFYYSEFDHEISPAWSPDGREHYLRFEPRTHLRDGRLLAHEGGSGCGGARNSL